MSSTADEAPNLNTGETMSEKAIRKFKENPLVPLGAVGTSAALIMAMVRMRQRRSHDLNHWLRIRVLAQGFTIVALVAGTYTFSSKGSLSVTPEEAQARREDKLVREREEFAGRMKVAEENQAAEEGLSSGAGKAKSVAAGDREGKTGSGSWWWFGWGRAPQSQPQVRASPSTPTAPVIPKGVPGRAELSGKVSTSTSATPSPQASTPEPAPAPSMGGFWSILGWGKSSTPSKPSDTDKKA